MDRTEQHLAANDSRTSSDYFASTEPSLPDLDEETELQHEEYDEITHFSFSTSSTNSSAVSYINQLCLTFDSNDSPSQVIKCKAFWEYLDSRPDLDALKAKAWKEDERQRLVARSIDASAKPPPPEVSRRRWLCQLLQLKNEKQQLHKTALAGIPHHQSECEGGVFADTVANSPQQAWRDMEEFEDILRRREEGRDPDQKVLGYKTKQAPPAIKSPQF